MNDQLTITIVLKRTSVRMGVFVCDALWERLDEEEDGTTVHFITEIIGPREGFKIEPWQPLGPSRPWEPEGDCPLDLSLSLVDPDLVLVIRILEGEVIRLQSLTVRREDGFVCRLPGAVLTKNPQRQAELIGQAFSRILVSAFSYEEQRRPFAAPPT